MSQRPKRLQWISLLYLLFFLLSVLSPSLYTRGYFGLSETRLEELTIFAFGLAGLVTFAIYERLMERRALEHDQVAGDYQKAKTELIESYAYIGSINRKIELMKKLADSDTLSLVDAKRLPKELFHALAANARAAVDAEGVLIRFVELDRLRTDREFGHDPEQAPEFHVANRELKAIHDQGISHGIVCTEGRREILVVPSDRNGYLKGYLLVLLAERKPSDLDISLLKVFVNQAEMLYGSFAASQKQLQNGHVAVAVS